jgi:NADPH:quinone reductase-like Zn-dependent oxidoreductase
MKAVVLHELGPAENLRLETVADPRPGPGEIVVRLHAAALNHRDLWIRKGLYAGIKLPIILGSDGAGEVSALGVGVDPSLLGKQVIINPGLDWGDDHRVQGQYFRILGLPDDGTYAEFVKAPATHAHRKPEAWSWEEAAALPLAGLTAYRAVVTRAQVQAGEHVLITGIGGGVSLAALQIAKARGAHVVVTSGSDAKLERAKQIGAIGGVNYKTSDWSKAAAALTQGGPDVVIDSVGGDTLAKAIEIVKPGGRIVTYGATTGPVPQLEVRRIFWKQISLFGTTMGTPREFAAMLELYSFNSIRPIVDRIFELTDAPAAHMRMEEAGQFGKIVLKTSR